jgi:hypothetical protein
LADLIPLEHFVDLYRPAHFPQVYIYASCVCACVTFRFSDIESFQEHRFQSTTAQPVGRLADTDAGGSRLLQLHFRRGPSEFGHLDIPFPHKQLQDETGCTSWIRRSTGRLCTDLILPDIIETVLSGLKNEVPSPQGMFSFSASNAEVAVIESLTLKRYYEICCWNLRQFRPLHSSSAILVNVGAVLSCPLSSGFEDSVEITSVPSAEFNSRPWTLYSTDTLPGEVTEDGWTRYQYFLPPGNLS